MGTVSENVRIFNAQQFAEISPIGAAFSHLFDPTNFLTGFYGARAILKNIIITPDFITLASFQS